MHRTRTVSLVAAFLVSSLAAAFGQPVPEDLVKQITAAAPEKASAKPAQPRKLLVFTLTRGFRHESIPMAAKAVEILGAKTGAFETVVSADPEMFAPDKLKQFDAVCMDSTTGELFDTPNLAKLPADQQETARKHDAALKQSLLDFVSGGKGLVGIHAATDANYRWKEYGEMLGGYFNGHPWQKIPVKIDDPASPINAAFAGQGFEVVDEIYTFKDPYSRAKQRVLLSVDMGKMTGKGNRKDNDYAVSWIKPSGKGRVFYCSLGHNKPIFTNAKILRHYLDGIQFALGDLAADAPPTPPPPDTQPGADVIRAIQGGEFAAPPAAPASQPAASQPAAAGFRTLFNGQDFTGWTLKPGSWIIQDACMVRKGGGYIWTAEQFGDFVLDLEFKVGGNSGVFFRTAKTADPVQTGFELQVINSYGKAKPGKGDCGAIYDCLAPSKNVEKKPGEWNRVVLTCKANKITVVMNGEQIIDMDLDLWTTPHKNPDGTANKFNTAYKNMPRKGYIGFQDHGEPVSYRNIRIKTLD